MPSQSRGDKRTPDWPLPEYAAADNPHTAQGCPHLFLLCARDEHRLDQAIDDLLAELADPTKLARKLERTYWRSGQELFRLAVVGSSREDLQDKLRQAKELPQRFQSQQRLPPGIFLGAEKREGKVAFLFPGQGSQFPGMLRELSAMFASVQKWCEELDLAYARVGRPAPSLVLRGESPARLFDMPTGAQLGLTASMAVAELLAAIGIVPDCLVGHSNGDRAALLAAGGLGAKDPASACAEFVRVSLLTESLNSEQRTDRLLSAICRRPGVLEAVLAEHETELFLAIHNSPSQFVLGGEKSALERAAAKLKRSMAMVNVLPFERAFHTPLVVDWSEMLLRHLQGVPFHSLALPVYSTLTATVFPQDADTIRRWMAQQWSSTVRFKETIEQMHADGVRLFIEVGPDAKLTSLVQDTLRGLPHLALSASSSTRGEWEQILHFCGELHAAGLNLDLGGSSRLDSVAAELDGKLPPAPILQVVAGADVLAALRNEQLATMQRVADAERRIFDLIGARRQAPMVSGAPGCGRLIQRTANEAVFAERLSTESRHPYFRHHAMGSTRHGGQRLEVVPFTYSLGAALDAAQRSAATATAMLRNVRAHRWLALDLGSLVVEIKVVAGKVSIVAMSEGEPQLAFEAEAGPLVAGAARLDILVGQAWDAPRCTPESFYRDHLFHGSAYHCIRAVKFCGKEFVAEIEATANDATNWTLDPALLDCAGQLVAYWMLENGWHEFGVFPIALESIAVHARPPAVGTTVRVIGEVATGAYGITSASFDYLLPDGRLLWSLRNFKQKILEFPAGAGQLMFGKTAWLGVDCIGGEAGSSHADWEQFLESGQGIWARVLAHSLLPAAKLAAVYAGPPDGRVRRMLTEIRKLETVSLSA